MNKSVIDLRRVRVHGSWTIWRWLCAWQLRWWERACFVGCSHELRTEVKTVKETLSVICCHWTLEIRVLKMMWRKRETRAIAGRKGPWAREYLIWPCARSSDDCKWKSRENSSWRVFFILFISVGSVEAIELGAGKTFQAQRAKVVKLESKFER